MNQNPGFPIIYSAHKGFRQTLEEWMAAYLVVAADSVLDKAFPAFLILLILLF